MGREIEVVYEKGVFKPLVPVQLEEGERLRPYIPAETRDVSFEQVMEEMRQFQDAFATWTEEDWEEFEQSFRRGK